MASMAPLEQSSAPARQEAARQEAAGQEADWQEAAGQADRQEAARQEAAGQEAIQAGGKPCEEAAGQEFSDVIARRESVCQNRCVRRNSSIPKSIISSDVKISFGV